MLIVEAPSVIVTGSDTMYELASFHPQRDRMADALVYNLTPVTEVERVEHA